MLLVQNFPTLSQFGRSRTFSGDGRGLGDPIGFRSALIGRNHAFALMGNNIGSLAGGDDSSLNKHKDERLLIRATRQPLRLVTRRRRGVERRAGS
jgi:hypothetical protein